MLFCLACFFQSLFSQPTAPVEEEVSTFADRIKPRLVHLVEAIEELYLTDLAVTEGFNEGLSLREHSLQTADVARIECPDDESLTVAALLYNIGHLIEPLNTDENSYHVTSYHFLQPLWGENIAAPILHASEAMRFLASVDAEYVACLSKAKQRYFSELGGAFTQDSPAYTSFRKNPHFSTAIALRRWDDLATIYGKKTSDFKDFRDLLIDAAYSHFRSNYKDQQIEEVITIIQQAQDLLLNKH